MSRGEINKNFVADVKQYSVIFSGHQEPEALAEKAKDRPVAEMAAVGAQAERQLLAPQAAQGHTEAAGHPPHGLQNLTVAKRRDLF